MVRCVLLVLGVLASLTGCASPKPTEVESRLRYRHSEEFVRDACRAVLAESLGVDPDAPPDQVWSRWRTNPAAFSNQGLRHRLKVSLEGDLTEGFLVQVEQDSERNEEMENPLDPAAAKWKPTTNDGDLAAIFLHRLDRRLRPAPPLSSEDVR